MFKLTTAHQHKSAAFGDCFGPFVVLLLWYINHYMLWNIAGGVAISSCIGSYVNRRGKVGIQQCWVCLSYCLCEFQQAQVSVCIDLTSPQRYSCWDISHVQPSSHPTTEQCGALYTGNQHWQCQSSRPQIVICGQKLRHCQHCFTAGCLLIL